MTKFIAILKMSLKTNVPICLFILSYAGLALSIIAGHNAKPNKFPYLVSIVAYSKNSPYLRNICAGNIIAPYWILTAAHCIDAIKTEFKFFQVFLLAGTVDIGGWEPTQQFSFILSYHKHPKFRGLNSVGGYDIGLLKLYKLLYYNRSVAPIGLSTKKGDPAGKAIIAGWGAIKYVSGGNHIFPRILQTTNVQILNHSLCRYFAKAILEQEGMEYSDDIISDTHVCSVSLGEGNSGCTGDSGAPLVQYHVSGVPQIVGILSYMATPCGRVGGPTVYVKVSDFIDWIIETIHSNYRT